MYPHVLVELNENRPGTLDHVVIFELDLPGFPELEQEILIPYLNGDMFLFNGRHISKDKIVKLQVFRSEHQTQHYAKIENEQGRNNALYSYTSKSDVLFFEEYVTDITREVLNKAQKASTVKTNSQVPSNTDAIDKHLVFIVHGHDDLAKTEVALFIERLGFKYIILNEQTSSGKTIIEKIEANSNVGFGIVLYTSCDVGAVKGQESNLQPRARQNVVFEHGYLIGKLGRPNVCALVKGKVELPNDMSGIVYTPMDTHKAWHMKVAKEMKAAGYLVDMNKL